MNQVNQASSTLPEGQELLRGLYIVQDYLQRASEKINRFWALDSQFQNYEYANYYSPNEADTVAGKPIYATATSKMVFSLIFGGICAISKDFGILVSSLIIAAIFQAARKRQRNTPLSVGKAFTIFMLIDWAISIMTTVSNLGPYNIKETLVFVVTHILALVVALIVSKIVEKKCIEKIAISDEAEREKAVEYNAAERERVIQSNNEIEQYNNNIAFQRMNLSNEITAITNEMYARTGHWYPVDYYTLDSVGCFIKIVKNHEADTIKEMIAIFKQDRYHTQVINNQDVMKQQLDESLNNQQAMINLQRISNVIQMATCIASFASAHNTGQMNKKFDTLNQNVSNLGGTVGGMADDIRDIKDSIY